MSTCLYNMEGYIGLPCILKEFYIKGKDANISDFGQGKDCRDEVDLNNYIAEIIDWGCCNYKFIIDPKLKESAMDMYDLTEEEYNEICEALVNTLSVGECGLCV